MVGKVYRAPDSGSAHGESHPKMVERRCAGRREADTEGRRNGARWKYKPASVERLPSLPIRPVGSVVVQKEGKRRCDRRANNPRANCLLNKPNSEKVIFASSETRATLPRYSLSTGSRSWMAFRGVSITCYPTKDRVSKRQIPSKTGKFTEPSIPSISQ